MALESPAGYLPRSASGHLRRRIAVAFASVSLLVLAAGSDPGIRQVLAYGDALSTTILSSSSNPSVYGQPVTITATVSGAQGTPTGYVYYYLDNRGPYNAPLVNGVAQFTPAATYWETGSPGELGVNPVDVGYSGDAVYRPSASATHLDQLVGWASTTTAITSSLNPSASGQAVVFVATVSPVLPSVDDCCRGGGVQFYVDGYEFGLPMTLDANNRVQVTHDYLSEGSHVIKAKWWGDSHHYASESELTQVVGAPPTASPTASASPTDRYLAYLTVVKQVVNDNGGDLESEDFSLFVDGNLVHTGVQITVTAGETHTVTDQAQPGYSGPVFGGDCAADGTVVLPAAAIRTCTVTNDDVALNTATLTVIKDVENRNGGTLGPGDFALYVDGQPVTSGVPIQVAAGVAHQVTEDVQPGYTEPVYVGACDAEGTVVLSAGATATCTLLNDDIAPYLKLFKKVINDDGGMAVPADWTLFATAAPPNHGRNRAVPGAPGVFNKVYANVPYTLSESSVPGYTAGAWQCQGEDLPGGNVVTLELGQYLTCEITNNDQPREPACIVGWGLNDKAQGCRPAIDEYVAIAAGGKHSLGLTTEGTIVGWGDNTYGQSSPPAGTGYRAVAAGTNHSLALRRDGSIAAWGNNAYGQASAPPGTGYIAIAAGGNHSLAVRADGSIIGWGRNNYGQRTPPAGAGFVAVAAGGSHSLGLRGDGSIVGWGRNNFGQRTPPPGTGYRAIAAGGNHSLALRGDRSIVGWGDNTYGQRAAPAGTGYLAISAGGNHSLALRADGGIVGWGRNNRGQRTPPLGTDHIAIAAGANHSLAIARTCHQPDGNIRVGSAARLGSDVYNDNATNQTVRGAGARGATVSFAISIENDGTVDDRFGVKAAGSATASYTVTYFSGTVNVTAAVVAGTFRTATLSKGSSVVITVKVRVNSAAAIGSSVTRLVTITSGASPATVDAVKLIGRRG